MFEIISLIHLLETGHPSSVVKFTSLSFLSRGPLVFLGRSAHPGSGSQARSQHCLDQADADLPRSPTCVSEHGTPAALSVSFSCSQGHYPTPAEILPKLQGAACPPSLHTLSSAFLPHRLSQGLLLVTGPVTVRTGSGRLAP